MSLWVEFPLYSKRQNYQVRQCHNLDKLNWKENNSVIGSAVLPALKIGHALVTKVN